MREHIEDLDYNMEDYEKYIENNGLPYCDYRIYRHGHLMLKPIQKFQYGIRRIINILRSYKSLDLRGLLEKVQSKIMKEKEERKSRRKSALLRGVPMKPEQKAEEYYYSLKSEMGNLHLSLDGQNQNMLLFQNKILQEMKSLRNLIKGGSESGNSDYMKDSEYERQVEQIKKNTHPVARKSRTRLLSGRIRKVANVNEESAQDDNRRGTEFGFSNKGNNLLLPSNFQDPSNNQDVLKSQADDQAKKIKSPKKKKNVVISTLEESKQPNSHILGIPNNNKSENVNHNEVQKSQDEVRLSKGKYCFVNIRHFSGEGV